MPLYGSNTLLCGNIVRFRFRKASEYVAWFCECSRALLIAEEAKGSVGLAEEAEDELDLQIQERDSSRDDPYIIHVAV